MFTKRRTGMERNISVVVKRIGKKQNLACTEIDLALGWQEAVILLSCMKSWGMSKDNISNWGIGR